MEISFVSPILFVAVFILVLLLATRKRSMAIEIAIVLMFIFEVIIERGFFVQFGNGFTLHYDEFVIASFSPLFLFVLLKSKLSSKYWFYFIGLTSTIAIGYFWLHYFPFDFKIIPLYAQVDSIFRGSGVMEYAQINIEHIKKPIRLLAYVPILMMVGSIYINYDTLLNKIVSLSKVVCIVLLIEYLLKNFGLLHYYDLLLQFVFNDTVSLEHTRAGYSTIQGLTSEPSHLAHGFIVPLFVFATKEHNHKLIWFLLMIILLTLTISFTNFMLAFAAIILFYMNSSYYHNNRLNSSIIFSVIVIFALSVLTYFYYDILQYNIVRLTRLISGDFIIGDDVRLWTISENLKYLMHRPFFGIGFGSTKSNGFIPSMLANIGFVGSFFWVMWHHYSLKVKSYNTLATFLMIALLFFIGNTVWLYTINITLIFIVLTSSYYKNEVLTTNKYNNLNL